MPRVPGGGPETRRGGPGTETAPSTSFNTTENSTAHNDAEAAAENRRIRFLINKHFLAAPIAKIIANELFAEARS